MMRFENGPCLLNVIIIQFLYLQVASNFPWDFDKTSTILPEA